VADVKHGLRSREPGKPSILHVTECFASGTASTITDFVRNYPAAEHHLVYSLRDEARLDSTALNSFASATEMPAGSVARVRFLRQYLGNSMGNIVVHAHSSKAGAYVRMAVRKSRRRPIVYTPHCYAFERLDVAWPVRQSFRAVEWLLSFNTTVYGGCSEREAELSQWALSSPRVVAVPNVAPASLPARDSRSSGNILRIAGNGRLGPQKGPLFFAEAFQAAKAINPDIEAVWVGGGDAAYVLLLQERGVRVTGWLSRREALEVMATCDVYLHTALWEGFPVSILEAAALGLPVVARERPYLKGIEMPAVIERPSEFSAVATKLNSEGALDTLARQTRAALAMNTDVSQQVALRRLYGPLVEAG
jgi:glycosyltransferase involved in cell wall biosynthesis